ncbi:MAG: NAD-dependent epimerase/dehydratase family protein [Chitinophagaceae bacterium]|nr:NAD-dependent epimerase/dehydratase family protein [Chitinophagaceae bacterium]
MDYKNKILQNDLKEIFESREDWSIFKNSTILISGANGFLPAYLVYLFQYLNDKIHSFNVKIIALVRNENKANKKFQNLDKNFFKLIVQDVSIPIDIKERVDYIIHAASQASPKYYGVDPVGTLNANILGTINLLELARKNDVKSFLYFSSGEVYGQLSEDQIPIKENSFGYLDPTNIRSCYAESKRMGENICISYCSQYGIKAKIVRPFHTYGPGLDFSDGRVFADFVSNVVNKKDIKLTSDGSARRAFCYLSDATSGFISILIDGKVGEAYNLGNPREEYSILELAEIITSIYPKLNLKVHIDGKLEDNSKYLISPINRNSPEIEKIRILGWQPKISVKEGFKRTIDSFL